MLAYPFRIGVLPWWLGLGLVTVVIQAFTGTLRVEWLPSFDITADSSVIAFAVIGIGMELFWWLFAFKIAVEALRAGASTDKGGGGRDIWIEDEQAARQLLLWGALLLAGYLLYLWQGGLALSLYCVLLALLLPAIFLLLGMEDSFRRAFHPRAWRLLAQSAGVDYARVVVELAALALLAGISQAQLFARLPRWLDVPLSRLLVLYVLFAGYHELGRRLDPHRRALKALLADTAVQPESDSPEAMMAWRAADRYAAEQRFAKAAQQLEPYTLGEGASPALHARFRDLLTLADDEAGLLRHAREFIPALLSWGDEREAMALYLDSLSADRGFELAQPRPLAMMIAVAMREHQSVLAISLAQEFLRRFPDDAEAVGNGLSAARLLDRMGRGEEARRLLVDLVRRFPRDPLRGELVAALETLEDVARRGR
jgi:hypothetical protein